MVKLTIKHSKKEIEILKYLTQFLTISQIAKLRKTSRTAIYKGISKLLEKGCIRKISRGSYEVTSKGLHSLNKSSSNLIRLHNLAFKITILQKPINWELKRSRIANIRLLAKDITFGNTKYQIHTFSSLKVKTTSNSIIFYMPSFYGKNTDNCFEQALNFLWKAIPKTEALFNVILIKDRKANIEIISQHYAKLQDCLAKLYKTEGNKLYIKDKDNNLWLIADYSFKVDELETIYNKTAKEDMDTVKDFLNDLRKNPATMTQVLEAIKGVTSNQVIFDKNFQSHLQVIKKLGNSVNRLTSHISKLKKEKHKFRRTADEIKGYECAFKFQLKRLESLLNEKSICKHKNKELEIDEKRFFCNDCKQWINCEDLK